MKDPFGMVGNYFNVLTAITYEATVQWWFTKRMKSSSNQSYDECLLKLENERLELCHLCGLYDVLQNTTFC